MSLFNFVFLSSLSLNPLSSRIFTISQNEIPLPGPCSFFLNLPWSSACSGFVMILNSWEMSASITFELLLSLITNKLNICNSHPYNLPLIIFYFLISMQKDPFGFKTQGVNYQSFRPKYPQALVNKCLQNLKNKNRYLDIATGTGYLLFSLASHFKEAVGSDISEKMLSVSLAKAKDFPNVEVLKKDCMEGYTDKFDLVTIGQALHWLPLPNVLSHISQNLLNPAGRFVVFSYYVQGIKQVKGNNVSELFEKYSQLVEPEFDFDRFEIYREYTDDKYQFKENFVEVSKEEVNDSQILPTQGFIGYMRTYSGYNRYKEKYPDREDPIVALEEGLKEHQQVQMIIRYFAYYCDNPK